MGRSPSGGTLAPYSPALPDLEGQTFAEFLQEPVAQVTRRLFDYLGAHAPDHPELAGVSTGLLERIVEGVGSLLHEVVARLGNRPRGDARAFSARVQDVHEWLAARLGSLPPAQRRVAGRVAVQDPCHLRHVQRAHHHVRTVLSPYVEELVELDDEGMCCGAGGAYSALHPDMAGELRARKLAAIGRTGASVVASANPGCALHLASEGLEVRHPVELVARAIGVGDGNGRGR